MVKSIFELERRFDFDKEFNRLFELLNQKIYNYEYGYYKNVDFWRIVDNFFTKWEHRTNCNKCRSIFQRLRNRLKIT